MFMFQELSSDENHFVPVAPQQPGYLLAAARPPPSPAAADQDRRIARQCGSDRTLAIAAKADPHLYFGLFVLEQLQQAAFRERARDVRLFERKWIRHHLRHHEIYANMEPPAKLARRLERASRAFRVREDHVQIQAGLLFATPGSNYVQSVCRLACHRTFRLFAAA
jgi:hypothetical protein